MGWTECPISKALCGAAGERVNTDALDGGGSGEAYLGFALSSVLGRHGGGVERNLLETPRLGQGGQGAGQAGESHELFLADFGVCVGVHWRWLTRRVVRRRGGGGE